MSDIEMSDRIAEEIRARLARSNLTKSELARRLNVSHTWVTNRLIGNQEIGTNELQRIAEALEVSFADLLPAQVRSGSMSTKTIATRRPRIGTVRTIVPAAAAPLTGRVPSPKPTGHIAPSKVSHLAASKRRLSRLPVM